MTPSHSPAAGEYVKLQDAFVSETGTTFGSWKFIGYKMETTNNVFTYTEEKWTDGSASTAELPDEATGVWKATPNASLNDCATGTGYWELKIQTAGNANGAKYKAHVKGADCNVLTPGFGKLDESGAAQID